MIVENKHTNNLASCLIIPVATKSMEAIEKYVGGIVESSPSGKWLYVDFEPLEEPNELEVWEHERSGLLSQHRQCWVHVDYTGYRSRYAQCYPDIDLEGMVVDHIRNRRFARILGLKYIRLTHVNRGVNSSSGRGEEYDVINYKNPSGLSKFKELEHQVDYADPADLLKMLNIKVGSFPLNNLRDNLYLFYG